MPPLIHPNRIQLLFRAPKTARLIAALYADERVPVWRKTLFSTCIVLLVCVLFFPDVIGETVLSTILPFIGTILGIPLDAGLDWAAFILLLPPMLRIFPAPMVQDHYDRIFSKPQPKQIQKTAK